MKVKLKIDDKITTANKLGQKKFLRITGITGGVRWWYEALIRGLGYKACDPSEESCCEYNGNLFELCPVCCLFGTNGWQSKILIKIKDKNNNIKKIKGKAETKFFLVFQERKTLTLSQNHNRNKHFQKAEKILLSVLLDIIDDYGFLAGKTNNEMPGKITVVENDFRTVEKKLSDRERQLIKDYLNQFNDKYKITKRKKIFKPHLDAFLFSDNIKEDIFEKLLRRQRRYEYHCFSNGGISFKNIKLQNKLNKVKKDSNLIYEKENYNEWKKIPRKFFRSKKRMVGYLPKTVWEKEEKEIFKSTDITLGYEILKEKGLGGYIG